MDSVDGKVALVTGGASGIGKATAHRLAAGGATVVVVDVAEEPGRQVAAEVGGTFLEADVREPKAWRRLVAAVAEAHGRLDIAHLNAGIMTRHPDERTRENSIDSLDDEAYRMVMAVNVDGVVFGSRAAVQAMREVGGGAIVVTSSLAGLIGFPPDPIYSLTKHAVIGLVRSIGPQLEPAGITVNAVCPGIVDTPLLGDTARETLRELELPDHPAVRHRRGRPPRHHLGRDRTGLRGAGRHRPGALRVPAGAGAESRGGGGHATARTVRGQRVKASPTVRP